MSVQIPTAMSPTPWSWQQPPLPKPFSVPGHEFSVPRDRIWHRKLWAMEPTHAVGSFLQPGFADILCSCRISAQSTGGNKPLSLYALRKAVRILRFERPTIASRLAWPALSPDQLPSRDDARLVFEEVASEDVIEKWIDEVVHDRSAVLDDAGTLGEAVELIMRDVGRGFSSPPSALFHVYYVAVPDGDSAAIVIQGSHALFDACGLTKCMNQLIANMAVTPVYQNHPLSWGDDVEKLVGSGVDYTTIPWSPTPTKQDNVMLDKVIATAKEVKTTSGLPIPHRNAEATTTSVFVQTISGDILRRILSVTRAHGCTLYPVLFAAMVLATLRVNPPADVDGLAVPVLFSPANTRRKGIITRGDDVLSALGYNVVIARDLARFLPGSSSTDGLWTIAKEVYAQMQDQQDELKRVGLWADEFISSILSKMAEKAKASGHRVPPTVTPRVSSLGVIDSYLAARHHMPGGGTLNVSDPIITVCICYASPLLGCMLGVHSFTWNDTSYVCVSFPEAFMGTLDEQKRRRQERPESRTGSVWEWSEEFMEILHSVADGKTN